MLLNNELPGGLHSITPYFTVVGAAEFIDFLVAAFNARTIRDERYSDNSVQHARLEIAGSIIMLNDSTDEYPANVSQIHLYVEHVDIAYEKALQAGATSLMQPNVRPHGDRMAGVKDPKGNVWWIATPASQ